MSNYRPIDSKREEFRKYLERAGVMDALTKVLVNLYEETEKPDDALDYVRKHLAGGNPDAEDLETVKADLEASKAKIEALEQENAELREKLAKYEGNEIPPSEDAPPAESPPEGEGEGEGEGEVAGEGESAGADADEPAAE